MLAPRETLRQLLSTLGPPILLACMVYLLQHNSNTDTNLPIPYAYRASLLRQLKRSEEAQCELDLTSTRACSSIHQACPDFDTDGLIPYLRLYACAGPALQPLVLVGMLLWLPILFSAMAMAASEFLAVHLEYIVKHVGISENLAGVTIFAFGNGCTDLFATFGKTYPPILLQPWSIHYGAVE